jgi:hypothetical protein
MALMRPSEVDRISVPDRRPSESGATAAGRRPGGRLTELRAWLDSSLFLESPPPPPRTRKRLGIGLGLAILGVLLILLRLGWSKPLDSVWAEDGAIFLSAALNQGPIDAVSTTYADYLHVVPRLLAEVVTLGPIEWAPELLAVLGAGVVVLCAFVVWWAGAAHLPDPRLRGTLAAMVVLLPVVGYESLANLAYVSWFMLFASFWLVLWRPRSLAGALGATVFIALTLMSTPLALFLVPIAAARVLAYRDLRDAAVLGGFAVGAAAQVVAIAFDESPSPADATWDFELIPTYLLRVVGGLLLGQNGDAAAWLVAGRPVLIVFAAAFAVLVAIAVARRSAPGRAFSAVAIGLSLAIFFTAGYQRDLAETMMWPADDATTTGARHTIVPVLLLLTVVLVQLQRRPPRISLVTWHRLRQVALVAIALIALSAFYVGNDFRFTPTWSGELAQADEACSAGLPTVDVPVAPAGWSATVPCSELR